MLAPHISGRYKTNKQTNKRQGNTNFSAKSGDYKLQEQREIIRVAYGWQHTFTQQLHLSEKLQENRTNKLKAFFFFHFFFFLEQHGENISK